MGDAVRRVARRVTNLGRRVLTKFLWLFFRSLLTPRASLAIFCRRFWFLRQPKPQAPTTKHPVVATTPTTFVFPILLCRISYFLPVHNHFPLKIDPPVPRPRSSCPSSISRFFRSSRSSCCFKTAVLYCTAFLLQTSHHFRSCRCFNHPSSIAEIRWYSRNLCIFWRVSRIACSMLLCFEESPLVANDGLVNP